MEINTEIYLFESWWAELMMWYIGISGCLNETTKTQIKTWHFSCPHLAAGRLNCSRKKKKNLIFFLHRRRLDESVFSCANAPFLYFIINFFFLSQKPVFSHFNSATVYPVIQKVGSLTWLWLTTITICYYF